jgi:hypothetical protein
MIVPDAPIITEPTGLIIVRGFSPTITVDGLVTTSVFVIELIVPCENLNPSIIVAELNVEAENVWPPTTTVEVPSTEIVWPLTATVFLDVGSHQQSYCQCSLWLRLSFILLGTGSLPTVALH